MRRKIVICAEYQGIGAVAESITGFQIAVDHLIDEAGKDGSADVVVFCIGTETRTYLHPRYANIIYRQYEPLITPQELAPYVSRLALPFMIEFVPWRPSITRDIVAERPDVIHTFQTIGATDLAGLRAVRQLRRMGRPVRLVSSVMTEIETYVANYFGSFTHEVVRFAEMHDFFAELAATFRLPGAFRRQTFWYRLLTTLVHFFSYPISRVVGLIQRWGERAATRNDEGMIFAKTSTPIERRLRRLIHRQICGYLHRSDAVTTSRHTDAVHYRIAADQLWHMPLSADDSHFYPREETVDRVRDLLTRERQSGRIEDAVYHELLRFLGWIEADPGCFAIICVGRLSGEKNLWLISKSFELLTDALPRRNVYWLACGTGVWNKELSRRFPLRVALPGLVPNHLLPAIFNLARSRHFVYVSASDTETYGITHEESQRCGLALVAMELGTRGHFYFAGDRIGSTVISASNFDIPEELSSIQEAMPGFACALNGFCIPDFSAGRGLNILRTLPHGAEAVNAATQAMTDALLAMQGLSAPTRQQMSEYSVRLTNRTKMNWRSVWNLLRDGIYADDRQRHQQICDEYRHTYCRESLQDSQVDTGQSAW